MNGRKRTERLGRMLAVGEQRRRASEREFALALARSADAAAQLSRIEGLILATRPEVMPQGAGALQAAAQLRSLLAPVAVTADARLQAARAARHAAEAQMAASRARARKLADMDAAARRALIDQALSREAEDRPATRRGDKGRKL